MFKERKNKDTIGIITFNKKQQELIEDLLEKRAQEDDEFKKVYIEEIDRVDNDEDVSLFVKNIENVQGDERDIIIFSTAYAKNINKRVYSNFGTLNQDGGENRLNVAISRAKKKIYVVTSVEPEDFSVENYYSKELKCAAVNDYLSDNYSKLAICKKYKIRSTTQLSNWILKYNSHEEIKSSQSGGNGVMTKGRTTTFEERVEIVRYCIENNKVSYQQVRNWVVKYEDNGLDALITRISRSAYYKWLNKEKTSREIENEELLKFIQTDYEEKNGLQM